MQQFPWLSYSNVLSGGICRCCILFPERKERGGGRGAIPGVLVLSIYQYPYQKALGRDGILPHHEQSKMHCNATTQADTFTLSFRKPDLRIDSQFLKQQNEHAEENRTIL